MFGAFIKGSISNKSLLPQLADLVIAYETPWDLSINSSPAVERLNNSAPNYTGKFNSIDNGAPGTYFADTGGPADQNTMFGAVNEPAWQMSNSANGQYRFSGSITGGTTPSGFTVFWIGREAVPGSDFAWQLTPIGGGGDTIQFNYNFWDDAGTQRPRFEITTTTGSAINKNEAGYTNGNDFRRYHCFATDFTGGATAAEYQYTSGLKPITGGGTMDSTTTTVAPNNPDTDYNFRLGSVFNRPRVVFQSIYVWKVKLTSAEISEVVNYINNFYIPSL